MAKKHQQHVIVRLLTDNMGGMMQKELFAKFCEETGISSRKTLWTRLKELEARVAIVHRGMSNMIVLRDAEEVGIEKLFSEQISQTGEWVAGVLQHYDEIPETSRPGVLIALFMMMSADRTLMSIHCEHLGTQYKTIIESTKTAQRNLILQVYALLLQQSQDKRFADIAMFDLADVSRKFLEHIFSTLAQYGKKDGEKVS